MDQPSPSLSPRRPAPLSVAASLGFVEGVVLVAVAVLEALSIERDRLSLGLSTAVFFAIVAVALLACAGALWRLHPWARGPLLLTQLMALGLAWNLRGAPVVAVMLVVTALVALAGLLHPDTMRALERDREV
ncbi:hypothetical protein [Nocardioides acrostichi]|uniref:Integral membrane protein n=1 Tax=Nocardioides acrostichi TaxID=2784339 RepID=A0A930Y9Z2_9ACTN|nr:hypothetical protein [Nocardioides acrostichi]MBF4160883.1 hypothetical protein [Nocardioides acrostichi]